MPSFLGDCINCTPALSLLEESFPNAKIHLILRPHTISAFERDPRFNCILDSHNSDKFISFKKLTQRIKGLNADAAVLMNNTFVGALMMKVAGIKTIVGYNKELRGFLLTHSLKLDRERHYINRYAYLANALCENKHRYLPEVSLISDSRNSAIAEEKSLKIGWCILSKAKLSRHYPAEQCKQAIAQINQFLPTNTQVYLLGAEYEESDAERVITLCHQQGIDNVHSLAGKTSLVQLIDTIADLDLLITADSGPLHIAAATKTPTIALHSKGTSAFSTVCPKGDHVHVVNSRWQYINDEDQVLDLMPEDIANQVKKWFNNRS